MSLRATLPEIDEKAVNESADKYFGELLSSRGLGFRDEDVDT